MIVVVITTWPRRSLTDGGAACTGGFPLLLDVVIVTFESAAEIEDCISAARACTGVGRVIVVDNASGDGSAAAARRAGADVVLENADNLGFARAVNQGLLKSASERVLLLNPDAVISDQALTKLGVALDADERAVMAGPVLAAPRGETVVGARRFSTVSNRLLWHLPLPCRPRWATPEYPVEARRDMPEGPVPVDYLWGAALLVRRGFLTDSGGLDERFFLYSEDEDLGHQARRRGLRSLLVPDAVVRHVGGASSTDAALAQARIELSNARLLAKWEGAAAARRFRAGIGPVLALRALILAAAGRTEESRLAWRTWRLMARPDERARPRHAAQ